MGAGRLRVGEATLEQLENPNYEEWDDEELIAGRRRNRLGKFHGRRPKVIPLALLHELNRRVVSKGLHKLYSSVDDAVDYLTKVASGKAVPDKDRINVCLQILNRVFGIAPQRIQIQDVSESPWEKAGVRKAIVLRSAIDVESEEFDNPWDE